MTDSEGNPIEPGDRVETILGEKMCFNWGPMTVDQTVGRWTVVCKKISRPQVPVYMASHLRVIKEHG